MAICESFLCEIRGHGIRWCGKREQSAKVFSTIFTNLRKFSPSNVSCYMVPVSNLKYGSTVLFTWISSFESFFKFYGGCLSPLSPAAHHGSFSASVPLIVNGNIACPYRTLSLAAEVPTGRITVSPSHIVVQPVPLGVTLTAQFIVSVQGFSK